MTSFDESKIARDTDGKFAPHQSGESSLDVLGGEEPDHDWGEAAIREGQSTPYGQVQYTNTLAPGITSFSTAGHGGIKLSRERQRGMGALAVKGALYEEDDEANLVGYRYPEAFPNIDPDHFEQRVKDYFPDQYEAYTGRTLKFGESYSRDEAEWAQRHHGEHRVVAVRDMGDGTHQITTVPFGGSSEQSRVWKVPADEYDQHKMTQYGSANVQPVFTPQPHHEDVTPPPTPVRTRYTPQVDTSALPLAARARANNDLAKRWRSPDGTVRTLREIIETEGVTGKRVSPKRDRDGYPTGRNEYIVQQHDKHRSSYVALPVSKALFDVLDVPDDVD